MTMTYSYRGRDARGSNVSGDMEAESPDVVASRLINNGVTPIQIKEKIESTNVLDIDLFRRYPDAGEMMIFTRQLYALIKAGVPIARALKGLVDSAVNVVLKEALIDVHDGLQSGRDLAANLSRHPRIFSSLYINVVRVGENSGKLEEALLSLYHYLEFEKRTRDQIKSALRYPIMVIGAIVIAISILMVMVVPQFARIYSSLRAELPWATKLIITVSDFMVANWPALIAAAFVVAIAIRAYLRTEQGRYNWDRWKFKLPVIGDIIQRAALSRFARGFQMTYRAGVPLIQALSVISRAVDNDFLGERVRDMARGVERGDSITRTASSTDLFTPLVIQMMAVGEETGSLDDMMEEVAEYYDREVARDVDNLGALIEPLLIITVGGVVLVLALGVFLPMWDLAGAAMGRK